MNLSDMAYQDKVMFRSGELRCMRGKQGGTLLVPYTDEPDVEIGDSVTLITGNKRLVLAVTDLLLQKGGTLGVGTKHPNLLTLHFQNAAQPAMTATTIHIGSVTGQQVQVGDGNSMAVTMHVHELVEKVAKSGDPEARNRLVAFLENKTVATIIGAGTAALISALGA
jgi:hypothetical protein